MLGTACRSSWNTGNLDFPKTFFFQICRLDGGFLILILSYVASPQCRTIFQVSHSVSASSAPYRLSDALNRHIPGLKSTLLLRRRKKIDGLEIHRTPARRATDALRRHLAHGFDILLPERRKDLPFSLNVLGMGFDTAQMEKADVVHLHWIGGRTVDFSQLRHIRRPLVYTLHDMFACTAGCHCTMDCSLFQNECRGNCPQLGAPRLFRNIPAWLFSRKRRAEVERSCMFPGRKIVQIYNPVDTDLFPSGGRPECHPGRPGHPARAFVIACGATGLFNPVKGGHFIPLVLEELYRRGHRNLHLLLFGNQEKSVDYPFPSTSAGFITDMNKLAGLYSAADIFLNPTLQDVAFQRSAGIHGLQNPFRYLPDGRSSGSGSGRKDGAGRSAGRPEPNGRPLRTAHPGRKTPANPGGGRPPARGTNILLPRHCRTARRPCMRNRSGNTVTKSENGRRSTDGRPVPVHPGASSFVIDKKKTPHTLCTVSTLLSP